MSSSSFFERLKETFRKPIDKAKRNQLAEEWIEEAERDGLIDEDDSELFHGVFDLSTRQVGEIMVPRTSVTAIPETTPIADVIETIQSSGHSRIPVYSETIDRIIGFVYAKDLLAYWGTTNGGFELRSVLREPLYTTEDKPVDDLLREMQKKKIHLAVVVDEYGTTSGLVSIEDIIELIVGDIHDEYDSALEEPSLIVQDGWVTAPGNMPVDELFEHFEVDPPEGEFTTAGGWIFDRTGRIPRAGESFELDEYQVRIDSADERHIALISIAPLLPHAKAAGDA